MHSVGMAPTAFQGCSALTYRRPRLVYARHVVPKLFRFATLANATGRRAGGLLQTGSNRSCSADEGLAVPKPYVERHIAPPSAALTEQSFI